MPVYVGGKRFRMIKDNFAESVESGLDALGWFDSGRNHMPVQLVSQQLDPQTEITPNIVAVSFEDIYPDELEMGSDLEENRMTTYVDVFAESDAIGQHLAGDVFDLLRGKFVSVQPQSLLEVYDLSLATPVYLFNCYYESLQLDNSRNWDLPFNKYWWTISLEVVDVYMNDAEVYPRPQGDIDGGYSDEPYIEDIDGGGA